MAGPVVEGRCVATNLPWIIDEQVLSRAIPAAKVRLLNDLEAAGHGVLALPDNELKTLQAGSPGAATSPSSPPAPASARR